MVPAFIGLVLRLAKDIPAVQANVMCGRWKLMGCSSLGCFPKFPKQLARFPFVAFVGAEPSKDASDLFV